MVRASLMTVLEYRDDLWGRAGGSVPGLIAEDSRRSTESQELQATKPRRDPGIQALRAVAVLCVVFYHISPSTLPGGFVGVDVFFVISGFLIISLLTRELFATGRINVLVFWKKRIARLLPAQVCVIVVSVVLSVVVFPVSMYEDVFSQVPSAVLNVHNWVLGIRAVDYLAQDGNDGIFDHYWSLSIEEQFYLVIPLVMVLAAFLRPSRRTLERRVASILVLVTSASLVLMIVSHAHFSPSDYFSTFNRAWQLGAGGLLAVLSRHREPKVFTRRVLIAAGLVAILLSALLIDGRGGYPGPVAVVPVLAAAACIAGFAFGPAMSAPRVLRSRMVQGIGNASYSIYLVHWPVLVLSNQVMQSWNGFAALITKGLLMALGSLLLYRFVENRYRRSGFVGSAFTLRAVGVSVLVVAVGISGVLVFGSPRFKDRSTVPVGADSPFGAAAFSGTRDTFYLPGHDMISPEPETAGSLDIPLWGIEECQIEPEELTPKRCEFGRTGSARTIVLAGDSHAAQWLPAVREVAAENDWRVITYFHSSCALSTVPRGYTVEGEVACKAANEEVMRQILDLPDVDLLVTSALSGDSFVGSDKNPMIGAEGFAGSWTRLVSAGIPVVAIRDNPQYIGDGRLIDCVRENRNSLGKCSLDPETAFRLDQQVRAVDAVPGSSLVDLSSRFCRADACPVVVGNVLVYRDNNHLTATYSRSLAPFLYQGIVGSCSEDLNGCVSLLGG